MSIDNALSVVALLSYGLISFGMFLRAKTTKAKIFTSILLGLFLAIMSYNFVPKDNFDLTRHQEIAKTMANVESIDSFFEKAKQNDLEIIPQIYSLVIGKTGNYNLMQTIVVLVGYSLLFYMLIDYKEKKELSNIKFVPILLMVIFGQHILYYFSGLYNYLAINIFAFALYLDYAKRKKVFPYFLYATTFLLHDSMILPIIVLAVLKTRKKTITGRYLLFFLIILLLSGVLLGTIINVLNIDFLNNVKRTYDGYIVNNGKMMELYDGFYLFMSITKIAIALFACWICRNDDANKLSRNYTLLSATAVAALSFSSIAITRFSSLVLFAAIPVIIDAVKQKSRQARILIALIGIVAAIYTVYSIHAIVPYIYFG